MGGKLLIYVLDVVAHIMLILCHTVLCVQILYWVMQNQCHFHIPPCANVTSVQAQGTEQQVTLNNNLYFHIDYKAEVTSC